MVDGWEPANELERRLLDAMHRQDQDAYFAELAAAELLLPVPVDAAGSPVDGWATWAHEGRTYLLAFSSPEALRQILGQYAGESVRSTLGDIASRWPDPSWWLAVDFGLPIAGYLPESFVTQLAASAPPAPAAEPDPWRREPTPDTTQAIPADAWAAPGTRSSDPAADAWAPAAQPAPDSGTWSGDNAAQPASDSGAWSGGEAQPAPDNGAWSAPDTRAAEADPWEERSEEPPPNWRPASTLSAGAVPAEPPPSIEDVVPATPVPDDVADLTAAPAQPAAESTPTGDDFQPANDTEQDLFTAARAGDNRTFLDTLLTSYALLPVPPDAVTDAPVSDAAFPWPAIQRNGVVQVPVFTSPERMTERVGESQFVVAPFISVVEHWPNHDWALALNPDTAIGATLSGDRIRELADWSRDQHLAERLGIPPTTPEPYTTSSADAATPYAPTTSADAATPYAPTTPADTASPYAPTAPSDATPSYPPTGTAHDASSAYPAATTSDATAPYPAASPNLYDALPDQPPYPTVPPFQPDEQPLPAEAAEEEPQPEQATNEEEPTQPEEPEDTAEETTQPAQPADGTAEEPAEEEPQTADGVLEEPAGEAEEAEDAEETEEAEEEDRQPAQATEEAQPETPEDSQGPKPSEETKPSEEPEASAPEEPEASEEPEPSEASEETREPEASGDAGESEASEEASESEAAGEIGEPEAARESGEPEAAEKPEAAEEPDRPDTPETPEALTALETPEAPEAPEPEEAGESEVAGSPESLAAAQSPESPEVAETESSEPAAEAQAGASGEAAGDVEGDGPGLEWPPVPVGAGEKVRAEAGPPGLSYPVVLQKVLRSGHERFYLERHFDQVSGYLHRVEDTARYAGPGTLRAALGEAGGPNGPCFVLRWTVERAGLLPVLAASYAVGDPTLTEYRVATMHLPHGTEMYRIGEDGRPTVLAVYDADHHRWHRLA